MASTDRRSLPLGPALRALAEGAAPRRPEIWAAAAESRRRRRARERALALGAAAALALALPFALPRLAAAPEPPAEAWASDAAVSEFAASLLEPRSASEGGLDREVQAYIAALWESD